MTAKVIYLNAWLDCPDVILKRNYALQDKITDARNHFFYKCKEEGKTESQTLFLYGIWIQKNRKRIKLEKHEDIPDPVGDNISTSS
jgi:hypothetical protein